MRVIRTREFAQWLNQLRDVRGRARIEKRIQRVEQTGYFGITRSVRDGVFEMKMDFGPGYRVYYAIREQMLVYLLAGGDKDSQPEDIRRAGDLLKIIEVNGWILD